MSELKKRFGAEVHAFVLIDNHYHLLVPCRRSDISETLRWLQTSYSVRFNWAHRRRGHVFQGRFKSVLIQDEGRLEEVGRYLHLNPVRITRRTWGLGIGDRTGWWRWRRGIWGGGWWKGAGKMPGVKYGSLAQGVRRFGRLAAERWEMSDFVARIRGKCK